MLKSIKTKTVFWVLGAVIAISLISAPVSVSYAAGGGSTNYTGGG